MVYILLCIIMLLLPVLSEAAYKVYLKNGSVITGVSTYEKREGEIILHFNVGDMGISEKEVLKIEETEAPEKDLKPKEAIEKKEEKPSEEVPTGKSLRISALRSDLETINSELRSVEENEARLTKTLEEKRASRSRYNIYQTRLLEREMEPLQKELMEVQKRKGELLQRKAALEGELRALE